jgi:hypothetical protein
VKAVESPSITVPQQKEENKSEQKKEVSATVAVAHKELEQVQEEEKREAVENKSEVIIHADI